MATTSFHAARATLVEQRANRDEIGRRAGRPRDREIDSGGAHVAVAKPADGLQGGGEAVARVGGRQLDDAFPGADAVLAARDHLERQVGVGDRAVGANEDHAVGEPVERPLERVARLAEPLKPPRHVERLSRMRKQALQSHDPGALHVALPARAVDGDPGELLVVGGDHPVDEERKIDRLQELHVERRALDRRLIENAVVPTKLARFLSRDQRPAWVDRGIVIEIFELRRRGHAEGVKLSRCQRSAVEGLERRADALDRARDRGERLRPALGVETCSMHSLDRSEQMFVASHERSALVGRGCRRLRS